VYEGPDASKKPQDCLFEQGINVGKSGKFVKIFAKLVEHSRQRHIGAKNIEHGRTKLNREQTQATVEEIKECIFN